MKQFNNTKFYALMALAMASLSGCGGGSGEADPTNIPKQLESTAADLSGSAVKGTLRSAKVSVSQLNGSAVTMAAADRTGSDGKINFSVQAKEGFGINSMFKVDVSADGQTSMICDAISCNGVALGAVLSGAALAGTTFST